MRDRRARAWLDDFKGALDGKPVVDRYAGHGAPWHWTVGELFVIMRSKNATLDTYLFPVPENVQKEEPRVFLHGRNRPQGHVVLAEREAAFRPLSRHSHGHVVETREVLQPFDGFLVLPGPT